MRIGGFVDISLVDVPKIPVTVIFSAGCNFDCGYCHGASLIPMTSGTEMSIYDIVEKVSGYLSEGVCISGGEPTVQKDDLIVLVRALKMKGLYVNINTNGSNPDVLRQLIELGLDSVWLDIKAPTTKYAKVVGISNKNIWKRVEESIKLVQNSTTDLWLRTTIVHPLVRFYDLGLIGDWLVEMGYKGDWLIQNYVPSAGVRQRYKSKFFRSAKKRFETLETEYSFLKASGINVIGSWRG